MLFSKFIVLTSFLVSSSIAIPVATPGTDLADGVNLPSEYWGRDISFRSANCEKLSSGAAFCSYTNQEVEDYNTANPGHSQTLRKGCVKSPSHTFCLLGA